VIESSGPILPAKLSGRLIPLMLFLLAFLPVTAPAQETHSVDKQLFAAIENGDIVMVERLLRTGANVEATVTNGVAPLMTAAEKGNVPLVSLLLEHGANPRTTDEQNETALTHAARGGFVRVVNLLAQLSDTKEKNRALFWAVESGPVTIEIVDVAAQSAQLRTQPTEVPESWTATVEALLDNGAEIEARNEDGSTPLIWAASFAQTDIFKLLVQRGARVNATDKNGNTPLMAAACQCAVATMNSADDVIRILLDQGAKVNARNHDGRTALMLASGMTGDARILDLLLSNGADPRVKDKSGKTALSYAKESRRDDKIQVLKRAALQAR
jgi:ankyrin repeat protein